VNPINIELDEETLSNLVKLVNIYSSSLHTAYNTIQAILTLPKHNGMIYIEPTYETLIQNVLNDYAGIRETAKKLETKPTIH
jgi:hypothetical protein